jgi:putative peptidoglycan lipid II flippase
MDFEAPHAGLALATSLSAWINAGLLFARLRRDGVYRAQPGWSSFALRLFLANALMATVLLLLCPALSEWLAAPLQTRGLWTLGLVATAGLVYFCVLGLSGMRPSHFRRR